jgi:hypothetical protein
MDINRFIKIFSIIIVVFLAGCNNDEEIIVCGPYDTPESSGEGEMLKSTFENNKKLVLLNMPNSEFYYDFGISDGDHTVFHFVRFWQSEYPDGYYECHFLFQIENKPEKDKIIIEPSRFREHKVFFRLSTYGDGPRVLTEDAGCIYLEKLNEDEWQVSANIIYLNIEGVKDGEAFGQNEVFQLTDTFNRGSVKYKNAKMHFGQ